jgi:hypothetical protein
MVSIALNLALSAFQTGEPLQFSAWLDSLGIHGLNRSLSLRGGSNVKQAVDSDDEGPTKLGLGTGTGNMVQKRSLFLCPVQPQHFCCLVSFEMHTYEDRQRRSLSGINM